MSREAAGARFNQPFLQRETTTMADVQATLRRSALPLTGEARDYDRLVRRAAKSRFALIGEASHGTHEFHRERAEITKRLIVEHGFSAVVAEADWPDAY